MAHIPVASPADLVPARLRDRVTTAGRLAADVAALDDAGLGTLPAPVALAPLLPRGGVERGRVYACGGDAPLSLLWTLVAPATREGSWLVLLDMDHAGLLAAHENGVALERTVCVSSGEGPGRDERRLRVLGALLDGFDVVVAEAPACGDAEARRLASRARAAGAVLVFAGAPGVFAVDVSLRARTRSWDFDLHARARTVEVRATGRRVHGSPMCVLQMPAADASRHH
ncbi:MAG: hypothetical protein RL330_208 [Actinomycetota bacterium]